MVFQSYAIWPHMTVFENVAYGLRVRRKGAAEIKEKVGNALDLVKMGPYADRNASQLSGGQQQRVALARACAFSPKVLLFDEPLSNLDAKLRAEMRIELRELQHRLGVTSVYVTRPRGSTGHVRRYLCHAATSSRADPGRLQSADRFFARFVGSASSADFCARSCRDGLAPWRMVATSYSTPRARAIPRCLCARFMQLSAICQCGDLSGRSR